MTRKEFIQFVQIGRLNKPKKMLISGRSVTDPSFARNGRQLIFQPLNIEYRMKYPAGVPLDKDNPMQFKEFDKLYPDTFKAIREANAVTESTKKSLSEIQEGLKKKPDPTPQN